VSSTPAIPCLHHQPAQAPGKYGDTSNSDSSTTHSHRMHCHRPGRAFQRMPASSAAGRLGRRLQHTCRTSTSNLPAQDLDAYANAPPDESQKQNTSLLPRIARSTNSKRGSQIKCSHRGFTPVPVYHRPRFESQLGTWSCVPDTSAHVQVA
jgi:hypothetical protein